MAYKVYVDGQEGTTGLKIQDYLSQRTEIELLKIDPQKRKDISARKEYLNEADLVFLCLPDDAAREAVSLIDSKRTKVIDASTAHRINKDWVYGLPELGGGQRDRIRTALRVANPGCHATGFILLVFPLIQLRILPKDYPVCCTSITGYSGGGKKLISKYETSPKELVSSPKPYGLSLKHKHLPEMREITGLEYPPVFQPVVANYYKGMAVSVPLVSRLLDKKLDAGNIRELLAEYYSGEHFIKVMPYFADGIPDGDGYFNPEACNDTNNVEIFVFGNDDQILLMARFDNLGKGASGAAIQNMNLMLGLNETAGL
ncbi:MAG TPA: N-acetyl-gamma-glutamyl-phosphate reductase [Clostridiales bacterium]|nr:N-acetyl-gamma-glutamyl-phosphate reductase [Clostridiales bacterium]